MITDAIYSIAEPDKRRDIDVVRKAQWLENGMIADDTNKWYWFPEVYDEFSHAEDPHGLCFEVATSLYTPPTTPTAIDLGSGTGRFIEELRDRIPTLDKIYAVDSTDEMVSYLSRKFGTGMPPVEPLKCEIASIPLPDQSIDLAVSSWGFPSRVWDQELAYAELREVHRVLRKHGTLITIGWDEDFSDEMTEVWYRFVMEDKYCFDSLPEYRRRKRERITSPRNCNLTVVKKRLSVPVLFGDKRKAAQVFGHLFGYSAGVWVLENDRKEFQMAVSVTHDTRESIGAILDRGRGAVPADGA